MGQTTFGVLYGCEQPDGVELYDEEYDDPLESRGLLNRWEDGAAKGHIESAVERLRTKGDPWPWRASSWYIPDMEYDSNLLGFWCAVGASGKRGIPALEQPVALSHKALREHPAYAKAYQRARRRWRRFARWAKTQGVTLPRARLYLTETEVA